MTELEVKIEIEPQATVTTTSQRKEVQLHGIIWEKDFLRNVFGVTKKELEEMKYTSKMDLPAHINRLDNCDVSIKTSCSQNVVCMADCLRVFDAVSSGKPIHMVVIYYLQDDTSNTKKIINITEVDLTDSRDLLFGTLTRCQIEELDKAVKSVPQKRKPTEEEYNNMYSLRNPLKIVAKSNTNEFRGGTITTEITSSRRVFKKK